MNTGVSGPPSVPTEEAILCGNLTAPTNGTVTVSGMNLNEVLFLSTEAFQVPKRILYRSVCPRLFYGGG